jgi:signal transduction histidine kinase/DNA-binding response OmpR family regulator
MKIIPRVLVVDKDRSIAKKLATRLGPGYNIVAASSGGKAAFKAIAAGGVDLAIVDSAMPGKAGFKLVAGIKRDKRTSLVPVILTIAPGRDRDRVDGIKAGCDDFITKPVSGDSAALRIKTALELSRNRPLLDEKEKFYNILNNMDQALVVLDSDLRISEMNEKARELLSIGPDEKKPDFIKAVRRGFGSKYAGGAKDALKGGSAVFDIERPESEDVRSLILEVRSNPIKNPLKGPRGTIAVLTDVTAKRMEEKLKRNFLDSISHKLRTPITVISGNVSMLNDGMLGPLNERQKKAAAAVSRQLRELSGQVDKLLGFVAVESGVRGAAAEKIPLKKYLSGFLAAVSAAGRGKRVETALDCPDETVALKMNSGHLDLIFNNLVENAIKFGDKDPVRVNVAVRKNAQRVEVSVSDNGRGIPPEETDKVFEKFYQIEKYFTGSVEGAGLGLAIVRRLVSAYGGSVRLSSRLGAGSTFTMTFQKA